MEDALQKAFERLSATLPQLESLDRALQEAAVRLLGDEPVMIRVAPLGCELIEPQDFLLSVPEGGFDWNAPFGRVVISGPKGPSDG